MANAILNFHFDFLNPSLSVIHQFVKLSNHRSPEIDLATHGQKPLNINIRIFLLFTGLRTMNTMTTITTITTKTKMTAVTTMPTMTKMTTETVIQIESYSNYNDYRNSDLYLDLKRFSDLVTQLIITDKLRNFYHDIEGQ